MDCPADEEIDAYLAEYEDDPYEPPSEVALANFLRIIAIPAHPHLDALDDAKAHSARCAGDDAPGIGDLVRYGRFAVGS